MSVDIGNGSFEYMTPDEYLYQNAFEAITQTNNWEFVKNYNDSFAFSTDRKIKDIYNKMESLGNDLHSGMSFGIIMRSMQFLAKHGEMEFKKKFER